MKTEKLATVTDCINNQSFIESELTVFPHEGTNRDVVVVSIVDGGDTKGVLLSPDDAKVFANSILKQVEGYETHRTIDIPTDSDVSMSIQRAKVTCNGNKLDDEVCVSLKDEDSETEVVSILTFNQTEKLIEQLQRLVGM